MSNPLSICSFLILVTLIFTNCITNHRHRTKEASPNSVGLLQNNVFNKLRWASRECVRESYAQFEKDNIGRDKEGSWVVQDKFAVVQTLLQDLNLATDTKIFDLIGSAPWPMWLNLTDQFDGHQSTSYEFSLFSVPAGQTLQPRRHPAGTIVLFKKMLGKCQMRTLISTREINKLELKDNILIRLAGTTKVRNLYAIVISSNFCDKSGILQQLYDYKTFMLFTLCYRCLRVWRVRSLPCLSWLYFLQGVLMRVLGQIQVSLLNQRS